MLPGSISETAAASGALIHLREPPLTDIGQEGAAARACRTLFGDVRRALLQEHNWNFAEDIIRPAAEVTPLLPPTGSGPGTGGTILLTPDGEYRYPLPDAVLQVKSVKGLVENQWRVVAPTGAATGAATTGKTLVCATAAPVVTVILDIGTVALWPPLFLEVFQLRLAARLAPILGQQSGIPFEQMADGKLSKSKRRDGQESARSDVSRDTSWIAARGGQRRSGLPNGGVF